MNKAKEGGGKNDTEKRENKEKRLYTREERESVSE